MQELSAYMISRQIKEMLPESVREYHRYLRWYRLRLHSSYGPAPNSDAFARARGLSEGFLVTRVTWSRRVLRSK